MLKRFANAALPKGPSEIAAIARVQVDHVNTSADGAEGMAAFRENGRRCFAAFSRAPAAVSVGRAGADYRPAPRPIIAGRSTPATHPNQRPRRTGG